MQALRKRHNHGPLALQKEMNIGVVVRIEIDGNGAVMRFKFVDNSPGYPQGGFDEGAGGLEVIHVVPTSREGGKGQPVADPRGTEAGFSERNRTPIHVVRFVGCAPPTGPHTDPRGSIQAAALPADPRGPLSPAVPCHDERTPIHVVRC